MSATGYDIDPSDDVTLQQIDRLRGLLAVDPLTKGKFAGVIRDYPVTVAEAGKVVASIHSPDEDLFMGATLGSRGVGQYKNQPRMILMLTAFESQKAQGGDVRMLYRDLHNAKGAFLQALTKYRADPSPNGQRFWTNMMFMAGGQNEATATFFRIEGQYMRCIIQFELKALERNP